MGVQQKALDAIASLTDSNRRHPDAAVERELAVLRHQAWSEVARPEPAGPWPPVGPDVLEGIKGLPDLDYADVTPDVLRSAVFQHGALLARGMLGPDLVERLVGDIDATMACVASLGNGGQLGDEPEWLSPLEVTGYEGVGGADRMWVLKSGTVWAADSPRTLFDIIDSLETVGLDDLLTAVFGRRPALSVTKFAVRKVQPDSMGGWHQDGYVLGEDTRTLNVWVALSHCGDEAPGLDIVPRRMDRFVETAVAPPLDFIVSQETIDELAEDTPPVRPTFEPGDALIFDQYLLHQTGWGPGLTKPRYGLECWFFCPSTYPDDLAPLVF
jgi:hypothetical protein